MSHLISYATRELQALGLHEPSSDYEGGLYEAVLELLEVFSKQGHSGASSEITIHLFTKLASHKPLSPLTGSKDEWHQPHPEDDGEFLQNLRDSTVFKDKDGNITSLDSFICMNQDGLSFSGPFHLTREEALKGENPISTNNFRVTDTPFSIKTFVIDVIDEETAPDSYITYLKDPSGLDEITQYYEFTQRV